MDSVSLEKIDKIKQCVCVTCLAVVSTEVLCAVSQNLCDSKYQCAGYLSFLIRATAAHITMASSSRFLVQECEAFTALPERRR